MIVIGVDIGSANYAHAVVEVNLDSKEKFKLIKTEYLKLTHPEIGHRMLTILTQLKKDIQKFNPALLAYEDSKFQGKHAPNLHYICGLVHLCSGTFNIPIKKYSPTQVKKKGCGDGKADKKAVDLAVKSLLSNPPESFATDHESDAALISLCPFL